MHLVRKSLLLVQLPLILNASYTLAMERDGNSLLVSQERHPFMHPRPYDEHLFFEPTRMTAYGHEPAKMVPFGHEPAKMVPYTTGLSSSHSIFGGGMNYGGTSASSGTAAASSDTEAGMGLGIMPSYTYNPCPQSKEFYRQTSFTIFRRHEYNCARFYMCNFGMPFEFRCPTGQLWDQGIKVCNFASKVNCNDNSID